MRQLAKSLSSLAAFLVAGLFATAGLATPITITYTADNVVGLYGQCTEADCSDGNPFSLGSNAGDWTQADSITVDLAPGPYYLAFFIANNPSPGAGNPGGFLAEVSTGGSSIVTSSDWEVALCISGSNCDFSSWVAATEYGNNGGANIWGNNGGTIAGIDTSAQWLWTVNNFANQVCPAEGACTDQNVAFRVLINVPEPATIALLGLGLVGLGFASRRKA